MFSVSPYRMALVTSAGLGVLCRNRVRARHGHRARRFLPDAHDDAAVRSGRGLVVLFAAYDDSRGTA